MNDVLDAADDFLVCLWPLFLFLFNLIKDSGSNRLTFFFTIDLFVSVVTLSILGRFSCVRQYLLQTVDPGRHPGLLAEGTLLAREPGLVAFAAPLHLPESIRNDCLLGLNRVSQVVDDLEDEDAVEGLLLLSRLRVRRKDG